MSNSEKTRTAKLLEDRDLGRFVAPGSGEDSEDTSQNKIKARILSPRAEEGRNQEMLGYRTKQLVTSLSDKAEMNKEQTKSSEIKKKTVSAKGLAKVLNAKAEAYLEKARKS